MNPFEQLATFKNIEGVHHFIAYLSPDCPIVQKLLAAAERDEQMNSLIATLHTLLGDTMASNPRAYNRGFNDGAKRAFEGVEQREKAAFEAGWMARSPERYLTEIRDKAAQAYLAHSGRAIWERES